MNTPVEAHGFPGAWSKEGPTVELHKNLKAERLVWMTKGHPFNKPVVACSNVGVKLNKETKKGEPFVRVELLADAFHGVQACDYAFYKDLEWLGPLVAPEK